MPEIPDMIESQEEPQQGDTIAFSMQPHPITGEPQFVVHIKSRNGDTADARMGIGDALSLGAQITAQATSIMTLSSFAAMQAQAAANPMFNGQ